MAQKQQSPVSGQTDKALSKYNANNATNNTTPLRFSDTMHRRMASYLINGWYTMPELTGGDKCGANPYQYIRAIRGRGVFVVSQKPQGERYGRYRIIHAVSRARVLNALDRIGGNRG